jgi:hypothetical protein
MHWAQRVVLGLFGGYLAGAVLGYGAIELFSGNVHDKEIEAAMTAAFATGPLGGLLGVAAALWIGRRR